MKTNLIAVGIWSAARHYGHHITPCFTCGRTLAKLSQSRNQIMNLLFLLMQLSFVRQILRFTSSALAKVLTWCFHCIVMRRQCLQLVRLQRTTVINNPYISPYRHSNLKPPRRLRNSSFEPLTIIASHLRVERKKFVQLSLSSTAELN